MVNPTGPGIGRSDPYRRVLSRDVNAYLEIVLVLLHDRFRKGPEMTDDQSDVIRFLSAADTFALSERVERIDTHCSIVFLAGDHAYKLKRAVSYSYLDYSTVELRRRACQREFALNRRTAPNLYIGVWAIRRRADGELGFEDEGIAVDWVVIMARFDQQNLFDRMATAGRLTASLMRHLADEIIEFHQNAEIRQDYGGADAFENIIRGNDENLKMASPPLELQLIRQIRDESDAALAKVANLLDQRKAVGQVRQCHGDLHLRNICLLEGRPTLFDCIEFNDALACIDVFYDLAFLLMDLHHSGHDDLGSVVFNRYLDISKDTKGLPAFPLFLSLRAAIRAHVAASSARKQNSASGAQLQVEQARAYLQLARNFLRPATPMLIAMGGLSGSGKSSLANGIAKHFRPVPGGRVIRSDVLRKRLLGQTPEQQLPPSAYAKEKRQFVYRTMFQEAAKTLEAGYTAILDATFLDPGDRRAVEGLPRPPNVTFIGLWLYAAPEILKQRVAARHGDASDADLRVLAAQLSTDPGPVAWHPIDVSRDSAACVEMIRRVLPEV